MVKYFSRVIVPIETHTKNGEVNGNPLQYSCLENSMDRGAWWATDCGVTRIGHALATKTVTKKERFIYFFLKFANTCSW